MNIYFTKLVRHLKLMPGGGVQDFRLRVGYNDQGQQQAFLDIVEQSPLVISPLRLARPQVELPAV